MNTIANQWAQDTRRALREYIEPAHRDGATRFFKEEIKVLGVRTPRVRKLAQSTSKLLRDLPTKDLLSLCEDFLKSGWNEEATIAFHLLTKFGKKLNEGDFQQLEQWLSRYITNWSMCDDFCTHVIGPLLCRFPILRQRTKPWIKSQNRWMRRASAVSLIPALHNGIMLDDAFVTAEALMHDPDDLVQKGYGWMLKVGSAAFPQEIYQFILKHKDVMPRTALRYALEKYPKTKRQAAMKK